VWLGEFAAEELEAVDERALKEMSGPRERGENGD
jgi:hypothetical protein